MWQLVKYEMEKLIGRRIVWACLAGMVLMVCAMIINWIYPGDEDVQYFQNGKLVNLGGKEGIQESQAIAEKYAGPLTDEKVQELIADFAMADEDMESHGLNPDRERYYLHNSLYSAMTSFMSMDGSWNGATVEAMYGELAAQLTLGYTFGWVKVLYVGIYTFLSLGCVLTILLAPLFAEEYTRGMDALILTSAYGKTRCAWAKIIAGFLFSIGLLGIVILTMMGVYLLNYGTMGWEASIQINDMYMFGDVPYPMTCGQGVLFALLLWFTAGLGLSAVSILISAVSRNSFSSLVISFAVFTIPLFVPWNRLGFLNLPAQFFPIQQIQLQSIFEWFPLQIGSFRLKLMWLTVPVAVLAAVFCSVCARKSFARHQVMGR